MGPGQWPACFGARSLSMYSILAAECDFSAAIFFANCRGRGCAEIDAANLCQLCFTVNVDRYSQ
jgi:hypothetical protein